MSEWKKVKIGDFLTEREGRYKPNDKEISKYQRLDKIDFSGNIHISDKPTKTDMIIVFPGDLVISGINVAKGAISVYQGKEPVCATIHYSSYTFDDKKVDLDYFKYFVKSPAFIFALQQQVKGGIKTEIKPKHLLPLEISLPDLSTQKEIVKVLSKKIEKVELIKSEIESQKNYAKLLRQNILQEAIEGKLTENWRKNNPVVKGNPDFDAEALFEKIQEEKRHTDSKKKEKSLPEITEDEKPFEIPEGWKWVRLGEICEYIRRGKSPKYGSDEILPIIAQKCNQWDKIYTNKCLFAEKTSVDKYLPEQYLQLGDVIINSTGGGTVGRAGLIKEYVFENYKQFVADSHITVVRGNNLLKKEVLYYYLISPYIQVNLEDRCTGSTNQLELATSTVKEYIFPLPPLAEQTEIVRVIESQLAKVDQLEKQIAERETLTKQLMQSILKDAFREV